MTFNKQVLTRYVQTECERQLFLDLAQKRPTYWLDPNREIEKPNKLHKGSKNLKKLGNKYEKHVYSYLITLKNVDYHKTLDNEIENIELTAFRLNRIHNSLINKEFEYKILLEAQYENPLSFFTNLFDLNKPHDILPIEYSNQRPDITIIGNVIYDTDNIRELLPDGVIREVPKEEMNTRFGISAIDIKNIRDINIGKKQFTEIIYYLWTLSYFLKENNLNDKFFVRIDGNGILHKLHDQDLDNIKDIKDLNNNIIKLHWEDSLRIFNRLLIKIKELWKKSPCAIKSIEVNIQPNCGYCYYIEDCKKTLGMDGKTEPKDWSLKLIPYTSMSIAQQLIEKNYSTIGDVANNIKRFPIKSIPEPVYPELPLLELKARALMEKNLINPRPGHVHAFSIPKYTNMAINFAVETDPANQRVYTASLYFFMSVSSKSSYSFMNDNWWKIWMEAIEHSTNAKEIHKKLNEYLIREIPLELVESFLYYLTRLKKVLIFPRGEQKNDGTLRKQTIVIYQFANVNEGDSDETEGRFARKIIVKLNYLLEMCNIIENYIVTDAREAGRYYGPTTSVFYWSRRQLNNFQDMLERNLNFLLNDSKAMRAFESIMALFTPSDSEVTHPYQHKKLFNLQAFTETIFGFPSIITYTWHDIAQREINAQINPRYWIPHFNYMDFNNWYEYILLKTDENVDEDAIKKKKKKIQSQIMFKVRTINSLRMKFQTDFGTAISKYSRVINKSLFKSVFLNQDYHPIAQVWYLFSKF